MRENIHILLHTIKNRHIAHPYSRSVNVHIKLILLLLTDLSKRQISAVVTLQDITFTTAFIHKSVMNHVS